MASKKQFSLWQFILRLLGLARDTDDNAGVLDDSPGDENLFPYHLSDRFLSPAEFSFYQVLKQAVDTNAVITVKVSLGDIFYVKRGDARQHRIYTNKIDRKHVDFLLCNPVTMKPVAGIELDDKSHQRDDRQARDNFVDGVFRAAGLPLIHIPVKRGYVVAELTTLLVPYFPVEVATTPSTVSVVKPASLPSIPVMEVSDTPQCPKCQSEMVLRKVKNGENAGKRFWGCSNYPDCRTMLPYSA